MLIDKTSLNDSFKYGLILDTAVYTALPSLGCMNLRHITPLLSWNAVISRWAEIETIVRDAMFNNPDNNPDAVQIKNWRTFTGLGNRLVHLVRPQVQISNFNFKIYFGQTYLTIVWRFMTSYLMTKLNDACSICIWLWFYNESFEHQKTQVLGAKYYA